MPARAASTPKFAGLSRPGRGGRAAFTLVELVVVMIVLTVTVGLLSPRLFGNNSRRAQSEAEAVRALVTSLAEQLADPGVIAESPARVLQYAAASETGSFPEFRLARRVQGAKKGDWTDEQERLYPPVVLESARVVQVVLDGRVQSVNADQPWRIEFTSAGVRPALSILLATRDSSEAATTETWQIDLIPTRTEAALRTLAPGTTSVAPLAPDAIDLDLTGGGETPW